MSRFMFFTDCETGGTDVEEHSLLEVGLAFIVDGEIKERLQLYIRQDQYVVMPEALKVNGLDLSVVKEKGISPEQAVETIISWLIHVAKEYNIGLSDSAPLGGHNVDFDRRFLKRLFKSCGYNLDSFLSYRTFCTSTMIRFMQEIGMLPEDFPRKMHQAVRRLGYEPKDEHTAMGDIETNVVLFNLLVAMGKDVVSRAQTSLENDA